jgi:hypothetical protein
MIELREGGLNRYDHALSGANFFIGFLLIRRISTI